MPFSDSTQYGQTILDDIPKILPILLAQYMLLFIRLLYSKHGS